MLTRENPNFHSLFIEEIHNSKLHTVFLSAGLLMRVRFFWKGTACCLREASVYTYWSAEPPILGFRSQIYDLLVTQPIVQKRKGLLMYKVLKAMSGTS